MMGAGAALSPERLVPLLQQQIPELMLRWSIPGLSVALGYEAALVWEQGFGVKNLLTHAPVTRQTLFEVASLSKPVVAYAALHLCTLGLLELDRPLAEYLPAEQRSPQLSLITLRHVLSHSTGLPNWQSEAQPLRPRFEAGTRFGYSGEGYVYLQRAIEHVTGTTLAEFMRRRILEPLGINDSSYTWRADYDERAAVGHESDGSVVEKYQPVEANAAYTLHTNAEDFVHFMLAALDPPGAVPVSKALQRAMFTAQTAVDGLGSWGLGWGLVQTPVGDSFWHWGDNTWFTCFAAGWAQPQCALVVLTNSVFGLQACRNIFAVVLGSDYPAFPWLFDSFYSDK
jgi:CubicO group peptidase (beta-lactamase class C family)